MLARLQQLSISLLDRLILIIPNNLVDRLILIGILIGAVSTSTLGYLTWQEARNPHLETAAFVYKIQPGLHPAICPGDVFTIPVQLSVVRTPVTLQIDDELQDAVTGRRVLPFLRFNGDRRSYGRDLMLSASFPITIPLGVAAGEYEYILVGTSEGAQASGFIVPITVRECGSHQ